MIENSDEKITGTELQNVQISQLNTHQLDELVSLVNERGVVFFKDQDLTTERQVEIFEHFGILDKHTTQKVSFSVTPLLRLNVEKRASKESLGSLG